MESLFFGEERTVLLASASDLETAIRNVLSELLEKREESAKDRRISRKEACKRLGKSISTMHRWEQQHMLHPIYIGNQVYYAESEINLIEER